MTWTLLYMAGFAVLFAFLHKQITFPWRTLSDREFTREQKKEHSRGFHVWTWYIVGALSTVLSLLAVLLDLGHMDHNYLRFALLIVAHFSVYSLFFDPIFALSIGAHWDYIGDPGVTEPYTVQWDYQTGGAKKIPLRNSQSDVIANKLFGKYAGRWKFFLLLLLVATILDIKKLFL